MKCPQCGIHYDDSERECPMCGARKPAFQKDASHLAKTTGTLARPSGKRARPRGERKTEQTETVRPSGRKERKSDGKSAKIVVLIIFLAVVAVNLLPSLVGMVTDSASNLFADTFGTPDPEPTEFDYGGAWQAGDASFTVILFTNDEQNYQIETEGYLEFGDYIAYENFPSDWEFPEQYPADQYSWWTVSLYPQQVEGLEQAYPDEAEDYASMGGYLSFFRSREDPDEVYVYDEFSELPWMEDGVFFPVGRIADEQTVNDLLAQSVGQTDTPAPEPV